jgi:hypothetical protein
MVNFIDVSILYTKYLINFNFSISELIFYNFILAKTFVITVNFYFKTPATF